MISRELSNRINWILDNLVPPVIRDSRFCMGILFRIVLGPKYRHYLTFKERLCEMTDEEVEAHYALLADTFMNRTTDLNSSSVALIQANVRGRSVIDVGCGRGFLIGEIAAKLRSAAPSRAAYCVGLDIVTEPAIRDGVHMMKGTAQNIPFPDKSFDTVICAHLLEHVRAPKTVLKELRRVARTRLIIVVPGQREYKYTFDLHVNFFPYLYSLKNLIANQRAVFYECGGDFVAVEDVLDPTSETRERSEQPQTIS